VDKEEVQKLITKFKLGLCNEDEEILLNKWLDDKGKDNPDYYFQDKGQEEVLKEDLRDRIKAELFRGKTTKGTTQLQFWLRIAAIALLAVTAGIWGIKRFTKQQPVTYLTLYNPAGQLKTITLSDGSKVFLNADTKITFPTHFTSKTRSVTLTGEAFFEVVHEAERPFIISTGKIKTQVLGTSFNIKAYNNEPAITVAVVSGKVGVVANKTSVILLPNQLVNYNLLKNKLRKGSIDDASSLKTWTTGELVFKNEKLGEIAHTLTRHYNIPVIVERKGIAESVLNARFDKNEPLEHILTVLCTYLDTRYKHEGKVYMIK